MLAYLLSAFCAMAGWGQVHYEDPFPYQATLVNGDDFGENGAELVTCMYGTVGQGSGAIEVPHLLDATVCNLGMITVGQSGDRLRILSNQGENIAETDQISSATSYGNKSIAVASNHNTEIAIVSLYDTQNGTAILVRILSNWADNGNINLTKSGLLSGNLSSARNLSIGIPNSFDGKKADVNNMEARMNNHYLYITWRQQYGDQQADMNANINPNRFYYAFAVMDIIANTFVITPQIIRDPQGNAATGTSVPTVACNRWNENDGCRIAFSFLVYNSGGSLASAASFTPNLNGAQPNAVTIKDPATAQFNRCIWVRVVNYDEPPDAVSSGYHYFYAYYVPNFLPSPGTIVNSILYSIDIEGPNGDNTHAAISDLLPVSHWFRTGGNTAVDTAAPACGNGYTDKAVYCSYVTDQAIIPNQNTSDGNQDLNICMQWGNSQRKIVSLNNPPPTNGNGPGNTFLYNTIGCNQMGVEVAYTVYDHQPAYNGGSPTYQSPYAYFCPLETFDQQNFMRFRRPFAQHIRENTIVTNDCTIEANQYHNPTNDIGIYVMPSETIGGKADTVRILSTNIDDPREAYNPNDNFHNGIDDPDGDSPTYEGTVTLKYVLHPNLANNVPVLAAGVPSSTSAVHPEANWNDGNRACILIDRGNPDKLYDGNGRNGVWGNVVTIDFNNTSGAFGAASNGTIQYAQLWDECPSWGTAHSDVYYKAGFSLFKNMHGSYIFAEGNHNYPDTLEKHRGMIYFNAPCTIDNGSILSSNKGQIRFIGAHNPAGSLDGMATLTINGNGTTINMDTAMLILGAENATNSLTQIQMNGDLSNNNINQALAITNSFISNGDFTGWPLYEDMVPSGARADILCNTPFWVTVNNNVILYTYFAIKNPDQGVEFNNNGHIREIRNLLSVTRFNDPTNMNQAPYCPIQIVGNTIMCNFPFQANSQSANWATSSAIDFDVEAYDQISVYGHAYVMIQNNTIWGNDFDLARPLQQNWTSIYLGSGTIASVTGNWIKNVGTGIYQDGLDKSTSYICGNTVLTNNPDCPSIPSPTLGIYIKSGKTTTKLNDLHRLSLGLWADQDDASTCIENTFEFSQNGAQFSGPNLKTDLSGIHILNANGSCSNCTPGANTFNNAENGSHYQVKILSSVSTPTNPEPIFGKPSNSFIVQANDQSNFGQNSFTSGNSSIHMVNISDVSGQIITLTPTLDFNYWNPPITLSANFIAGNADAEILNLGHWNVQAITNSNNLNIPSMACDNIQSIKPKGNGTMGIITRNSSDYVLDDSTTDSLYYYNMSYADQYSNPQQAYSYCRKYVELHPFATTYPGEVCYAISESEGYLSLIPGRTTIDFKRHYNWLLHIQPANMERSYQGSVMYCLAQTMSDWDNNGSANMWYNYGLIYGDWTTAWSNIKDIRHYQQLSGQDTTPFTVIKYPPDSLVLAGVIPSTPQLSEVTLLIVPNPADLTISANFTLPNSGVAMLELYNELGEKVKNIFSGYLQSGKQSITIDIHDISQGEYYLRMAYPGGVKTVKLIHK